jgi:hypothetical protein
MGFQLNYLNLQSFEIGQSKVFAVNEIQNNLYTLIMICDCDSLI